MDLYRAEYEVCGLRRPQDNLLQEVPFEIPWMGYWESTPGGVSAGLQTQGAGSRFTQLLCFGFLMARECRFRHRDGGGYY